MATVIKILVWLLLFAHKVQNKSGRLKREKVENEKGNEYRERNRFIHA
jgi:hypothetical protein